MQRLGTVLAAAWLLSCGTVALGQARGQNKEREPPARPVPSYSDEDLARYREQRERAGHVEAMRDQEASLALRSGSSGTAGTGVASRTGRVDRVSVVLEDRNGKLPAQAREEAQRIAERMIALYGDPIGADGPIVIPLRYFDTEEAYVDHAARDSWVDPRWYGFYSPQRDEIVVSNRGAYFEILIHEINHFIVRRIFPEAPRWLDEGLSEYFEHASFRGDELASGSSE